MGGTKKVLIPLHDFSAGGTEIHALRLASEWVKCGLQVDFLVGARDGALEARLAAVGNVTLLDPPVARSRFSRLHIGEKMIEPISRIDPDLVFIPGNFHFVLAHAIRKRWPHLPIVGKISNPLLPPTGLVGVASRAVRVGMKWYLSPFSTLVAMSRGLEEECRKFAPVNTRLTTIFDPTIPDETTILPMRKKNSSRETIRLLAIGRFEPQKDIPLAINTFSALLRYTRCELTIVGDGSLRPFIESKVKRMGLGQHIRFTGFIDSIVDELDRADVLLITSRYEGGPATAVEALARGLPVVSTDCSWFLHEIISDPAFGTIAKSRSPKVLARAVLQQLEAEPASGNAVDLALSRCRFSVSARAYLTEFDSLQQEHQSFTPSSAA